MKHTFNYIKNYFKQHQCELLEDIYINNKAIMKYKCSCNNISKISFNHFQKGVRCMKCKGSIKYTLEYVKKYFEQNNCILISNYYINTDCNLEYLCKCGNHSKISFNRFKKGDRCRSCGFDKSSKSSKKFKDYKTPEGNIRRIQGFENFALDELFKKYKDKEIYTDRIDMPKFLYIFNNKESRYYPDIYIYKENKVIKVKSDYTYKVDLLKNIEKSKAVKNLNYDFEFWIYDKHHNKTIINT